MTIGPKNILVYRLGSLGDTILALPVFHQIRRSYPDAVITLLTNKPVTGKAAPMESILGSGYFFDKVIAYPVGTRNKGELFDLIKKIRTLKIDAVIYLAGVRVSGTVFKTKLTLLRDWLFFKVAGVKTTIGFPSRQEDIFLVNDIETGELEWETKRLARRVGKLGNIALDDETYWDLRFTGHEVAQAAEILKELLPTGKYIGGKYRYKKPGKPLGAT